MSKDGTVAAFCDNTGHVMNGNDIAFKLNSHTQNCEPSVDNEPVTVRSEDRSEIYKKNIDNEADHSFGTDLRKHHLQTVSSHCIDDENMDVEAAKHTPKEYINEPVNFTNIESFVGSNEGKISSLPLKDDVGSKLVPDKKHSSSINTTVFSTMKSGEALKHMKSVKSHTGGCRSSTHDTHDSSLRMDALPNVSPDSGIISIEGSPFGNESPHSLGGGEISQESHLPPVSVVGRFRKGNEETSKVILTSDFSVSKQHGGKEQSSLINDSDKSDVTKNELDEFPSIVSCIETSQSDINKPLSDVDDFDSQSCVENNDAVMLEDFNSNAGDLSLSASTDTDVNKNEKLDGCSRSRPYINFQSTQTGKIVKVVNDLEEQVTKSEQISETFQQEDKHDLPLINEAAKNNDCVVKKKSVGRPKGSVNRKFGRDPPRRTYRKSVPKQLDDTLKVVKPCPQPEGNKMKRPRGRPRKVISANIAPTNSKPPSIESSVQVASSTKIKKRKIRKRVFTRVKKTVNKMPIEYSCKNLITGGMINNDISGSVHDEPPSRHRKVTQQHSSPNSFMKLNVDLLGSKSDFIVNKSEKLQNETTDSVFEKSDFSSQDLEVILKSVKNSISSQFKTDKDDEMDNSLHFDNPFKFSKAPSFPPLANPAEKSPVRIKPKYKKPKLHVMMRKTKRRKKKKKFESSRLGGFGASSPQQRMSFFTSRIQPSKILASSRLNVFQTGTGVDTNRPETPTDGEQTEGSEKRTKKRRKLLSFKSKHKNITDPALAADLDIIEGNLKNMTISENPADNFIRVRPGEMPLPSIFRVRKIDVMDQVKDKFMCEFGSVETSKLIKSARKEIASQALNSSAAKNLSKSLKKKSSPEEINSCKDPTSFSDSSDQWLPPKKRHRMVHGDTVTPQAFLGGVAVKDVCPSDGKRKGRRQKRIEGGDVSSNISHPNVDQVLTIDTSSYSTAGSSVSTLTPSPCPSRQSTRSSTFTSISSLSPSESNQARQVSKIGGSFVCSNHALGASFQSDFMSCAECQLLRRSTSRTSNSIRFNPSFTQSSNQSFGFSPSFDNQTSSSECSPVLKNSAVPEEHNRRYPLKTRKHTNYANREVELSPPHLEKQSLQSSSIFNPELPTAPPDVCSQRRNLSKKSGNSSCVSTVSVGIKSGEGSSISHKQLCNTNNSVNLSHLSASPSVIPVLSDSDRLPLPLEHCKKKDVLADLKAALYNDSSDRSSSSSDEEKEDPHPSSLNHKSSGQPPRKRYQRVGLFSDFYKDDEPRKRCENMIRCRDKLVYKKEEHEYGLMPLPIHVGYHNMTQMQDFELPYDIWWQDSHNQLPKKSEAKTKFRTIRSNVYVDGKANSRKTEIPACSCKPSPNGGMGCQDDCLNRMIYTECSVQNCPLGEQCDNQRIQKHEWAPGIEKFLTKDRGIGVRVTKPVRSGQFILEYLGEVVTETELRRRMMEEYSEECHHYALHLDSGNVIDGYRMGNTGRYVNHSCQPNCEMQKWNVNGLYRMVLVAQRDIEAYEELGYDYNFDAFNQETQQECRCGSSECRGVIGGKGQRNSGPNKQDKASDDTKDKRKSKLFKKSRDGKYMVDNIPVLPPMTSKERWFARKHSIFLVRNVDKVLNQRHPGQVFSPVPKEEVNLPKVNCVTSDVLLSNLTESSVKTRLASFAKDNPEVLRRHQLAQLFDKVLTELLSLKDEEGNSLVTPLMSLPSRKKQPQYYQIVKEPIDLSVIKQRVKTGHYSHLKPFNADLMLLFKNVELYCGPRSDMGQIVIKLRQMLQCALQDLATQIDDQLGAGTTKLCVDMNLDIMDEKGAKDKQEPEEDIIRCICGVTRDEGLMLQCEKCLRWQHCDCVRASGKEEHYLCDRCEPRYYDPEILLAPPLPDSLPDCTHYMTLVKEDVQYAIGDCVYVMRDCKRSASGTPLRSSHRLIATSNPDSLDIFRIEQLWKDPKGERFASGTPYLRPQETFHEPTRKFLHNELFRTPNYEIIPLDLVMGKCVVMDPTSYCKGRPKGVKEQDVYVCEYRVDKTAHLFHKIKEIWYPINTNRFCFDYFETKLALKRTFTPHEIPEEYRRKAGKGSKGPVVKEETLDVKVHKKSHLTMSSKVKIDESLKHDVKLKSEVKVNVNKGSDLKQDVKTEVCMDKSLSMKQLVEEKHQEKRHRLDKLCVKLLNNMPGKQKVDLSYLLDGGKRVRKKSIK